MYIKLVIHTIHNVSVLLLLFRMIVKYHFIYYNLAEGDMRNALNALQSTVSGFGIVTSANVFKVSLIPSIRMLFDERL